MEHSEFVEGYKKGKLKIYIDKYRAGEIILLDISKRSYRYAHKFWLGVGYFLIISSIALIFYSWLYAIGSIFLGFFVTRVALNVSRGFVRDNMLEDEKFYNKVMTYGVIEITKV